MPRSSDLSRSSGVGVRAATLSGGTPAVGRPVASPSVPKRQQLQKQARAGSVGAGLQQHNSSGGRRRKQSSSSTSRRQQQQQQQQQPRQEEARCSSSSSISDGTAPYKVCLTNIVSGGISETGKLGR